MEAVSLPVRRNDVIAPGVHYLEIGPMDPPPFWKAGQWISLHLPVGDFPPLVRAYTLAAPPDGSGILPLVFDRVEGGLGSGYLASLRSGAVVDVAAIVGKFTLPDPLPEQAEAEILFGARYTGIVPVRAMLLTLRQNPTPPRTHLVYGAPRASSLIFHEEFLELARTAPWFEYHPTVLEPDPGWEGAISPELDILRPLAGAGRRVIPMLCGVRAFTQPARLCLMEELGFDRRAVKVENYD